MAGRVSLCRLTVLSWPLSELCSATKMDPLCEGVNPHCLLPNLHIMRALYIAFQSCKHKLDNKHMPSGITCDCANFA